MPEEGRERWSTRTAFVMAAIGSAVGLGNVWRFPYVAYANGGGAFFIPYLIALITAGIPLMILEFGIGQMMQGSAPKSLRKCNRHAEWIGWFALLTGTIISIYYAAIMAYAVEYLVYAVKGLFTGGVMPWSDPSILPASEAAKGTPPEAYFFTNRILNLSLDSGSMWQTVWPVALGLLVVWASVFVIIYRGVRRVGRVVMWTVPLPVIVLGILIVRGLTLPGSAEGIRYYLTPSFEALRNPQTWLAAYGQVFFSLTIGFGVQIAYASYRPRKSDVTNNAFITSFANCATSFFAGFAVFSVLGYLAFARGGVPVKDVLAGGPGLVFVTYPMAISLMGEFGAFWPPIVAILFFVMLLTLGVDSLFSLVEGAVTGLKDRFPWLKRSVLAGGFCVIGLVTGILVFASRAGIQWLDVLDYWTNNYGLVLVGLLQCVVVGYFFKSGDLRDRINAVSEIKLWGWWELCIRAITPLILVYVLGAQVYGALAKGELYGLSGTDFDRYVWIAPAIFGLCFIIAFLLSRQYSNVAIIGFAVAIFFVAWLGLRRTEPFDVKVERLAGESDLDVVLRATPKGGDPPYSYLWNLGDGATATDAQVSHRYGNTEERMVAVSVTDADGRSVDRQLAVDPASIAVAAEFEPVEPTDRDTGMTVVFRGSAEHVHPKAKFTWDFGDGSDTVAEAVTRHTYRWPGEDKSDTYTARLTVTDGLGRSVSDTVDVRVYPALARVVARPLHGPVPLRTAFLCRLSVAHVTKAGRFEVVQLESPSGWSYEWDFGDGTTSQVPRPVHVYAKPGNYRVTLKVMPAPPATMIAPDAISMIAPDTISIVGNGWEGPDISDTLDTVVPTEGMRVLDLDLRDTDVVVLSDSQPSRTETEGTWSPASLGPVHVLEGGATVTVADGAPAVLGGPILGAITGAILIGGLIWCLLIARRHGSGEKEVVHGLPAADDEDE